MARKEITITLDESAGRDAGKAFAIREMPASRAENWAVRALLAIASSGRDIAGLDHSQGVAGLAHVGVGALTGLTWEQAGPLYDELLTCVSRVDLDKPGVKIQLTPNTVDAHVEEVGTLLSLRMEVLKLHMDFSKAGGLLNSIKTMAGQP